MSNGLRFDIYERVHLPENVAAIDELEEVELVPRIQVIDQGENVILQGQLVLNGIYRAQGATDEQVALEHWIPVEITLPLYRVVRLDDITVDIDTFDVTLLSDRALNLTGVLSLRGISLEQEEEQETWNVESFTTSHVRSESEAFEGHQEADQQYTNETLEDHQEGDQQFTSEAFENNQQADQRYTSEAIHEFEAQYRANGEQYDWNEQTIEEVEQNQTYNQPFFEVHYNAQTVEQYRGVEESTETNLQQPYIKQQDQFVQYIQQKYDAVPEPEVETDYRFNLQVENTITYHETSWNEQLQHTESNNFVDQNQNSYASIVNTGEYRAEEASNNEIDEQAEYQEQYQAQTQYQAAYVVNTEANGSQQQDNARQEEYVDSDQQWQQEEQIEAIEEYQVQYRDAYATHTEEAYGNQQQSIARQDEYVDSYQQWQQEEQIEASKEHQAEPQLQQVEHWETNEQIEEQRAEWTPSDQQESDESINEVQAEQNVAVADHEIHIALSGNSTGNEAQGLRTILNSSLREQAAQVAANQLKAEEDRQLAEAEKQQAAVREDIEWQNLFLSKRSDQNEFKRIRMIIVQKDDTLEQIANRYSISPRDLLVRNNLHESAISQGQLLYIP